MFTSRVCNPFYESRKLRALCASVLASFATSLIFAAPPTPIVDHPGNNFPLGQKPQLTYQTTTSGTTLELFVDGVLHESFPNMATTSHPTISNSLPLGSHQITFRAVDGTGSSAFTSPFTWLIQAPNHPKPIVAEGSPIITNSSNLTLNVTNAQLWATLFGRDMTSGSVVGQGLANNAPNGLVSFFGLPEGTNVVCVLAYLNGTPGFSECSNPITVVVDKTAAIPVITSPLNGAATNNRPSISGTAEPLSAVSIFVDGVLIGTAPANASGAWSFVPTNTLSDGPHQITATALDLAGNLSPMSPVTNIVVDSTRPLHVTIATPLENSTVSPLPLIIGGSEPNAVVHIYIDDVFIADVNSVTLPNTNTATWSFTVVNPLSVGRHELKASQTDQAGNTSEMSGIRTFFVLNPPTVPVISFPGNGATTNPTPNIRGTVTAGSSVEIILDGVVVGEAPVDNAGNWSFTPSPALNHGQTYQLTARAKNLLGTGPASSPAVSFTVDGQKPVTPVIVVPVNDTTSAVTRPTLFGTAEVNSTVNVYQGANVNGPWTLIGSYVAQNGVAGDPNLQWFLQVPSLTGGAHYFSAVSVDSAGNESDRSSVLKYTVDATAPLAPVITAPANNSVLTDTTPTITGTAEAGSTVRVLVDGVVLGVALADGSGAWTLTPSTPLAKGAHVITASATDGVGNVSLPSQPVNVTIDADAPSAPAITSPVNNSTLSNARPTVVGNAEPGSTVIVLVDGIEIGTTVADGSGNWSFVPTTPLANGNRQITAKARDAAGNISPASGVVNVKIDTNAPGAPVITSPVDGGNFGEPPTTTGTSEPNSTVKVFLDGVEIGTTIADGNGNWSFPMPINLPGVFPLPIGSHQLTASARDAAGNVSPLSGVITIIIGGPAAAVSPDFKNFFNPRNETVTIPVTVDRNGHLVVTAYDHFGDKVKDLFDGDISAGTTNVSWNGLNLDSSLVGSGLYIVIATLDNDVVFKTKVLAIR